MTQMYSVRSRESWGIGDYGDLKRLLADAAEKSKADFMLINPIHAARRFRRLSHRRIYRNRADSST